MSASTDHMKGLDSVWFHHALSSRPGTFLYCSTITKKLLINFGCYEDILPFTKELPYDVPTEITTVDYQHTTRSVYVTLIEANHCPGSVMFLFEGDEGVALYTGDFRFDVRELASLKPLHNASTGKVKVIRSAYIDTTFCVPEAMFIPSREETAQAVIKLTSDWLDSHPGNMVVFNGKARIGYEFLYQILHESFSMKVHVSEYKMKLYQDIAAITNHVTSDESATRLHSCISLMGSRGHQIRCKPLAEGGSTMTLVLSTMWFTQRVDGFDKIVVPRNNRHRVCCSFHSSYTEVRDFVSYLRPENVFPNVVPMNHSHKWVQHRLDLFKQITLVSQDGSQTMRPLGRLRKRKKITVHRQNSSLTDSENLLLSDSPISKKSKLNTSAKDLLNTPLHDKRKHSSSSPNNKSSCNESMNSSELSPGSQYSTDSKEDSGSELELFSDECNAPTDEKGSYLTYMSDDESGDEEYEVLMKQNRQKCQEQDSQEFSFDSEATVDELPQTGQQDVAISNICVQCHDQGDHNHGSSALCQQAHTVGAARNERGVTPLLFPESSFESNNGQDSIPDNQVVTSEDGEHGSSYDKSLNLESSFENSSDATVQSTSKNMSSSEISSQIAAAVVSSKQDIQSHSSQGSADSVVVIEDLVTRVHSCTGSHSDGVVPRQRSSSNTMYVAPSGGEIVDLTQDSDSDATVDFEPVPEAAQTLEDSVIVLSSLETVDESFSPELCVQQEVDNNIATCALNNCNQGNNNQMEQPQGGTKYPAVLDTGAVIPRVKRNLGVTVCSSNGSDPLLGVTCPVQDGNCPEHDSTIVDQHNANISKSSRLETSPVFDRYISPQQRQTSQQQGTTSRTSASPEFLINHTPDSEVPTESQIEDVHVQYVQGNFNIKHAKKKIDFNAV